MGRRYKIALDFDGTLARSMEAWVEVYNEEKDKNIHLSQITEWDFERKLGLTHSEKIRIFKQIWGQMYLIKPEEVLQFDTIRRLGNIGQVDVVTTILPEFKNHVEMWLLRHNITVNKVIMAEDNKEQLDYDFYIDDNPHLADRMKTKPNKYLMLYDQYWNRHIRQGNNIFRVTNLKEALDNIYNTVSLIEYHNEVSDSMQQEEKLYDEMRKNLMKRIEEEEGENA